MLDETRIQSRLYHILNEVLLHRFHETDHLGRIHLGCGALYPSSGLNLVEGFFSKLARSVLRHIRVASKQELKDRIMAAMDEFNRHPVVYTWSYKLDQAAYRIRTLETLY